MQQQSLGSTAGWPAGRQTERRDERAWRVAGNPQRTGSGVKSLAQRDRLVHGQSHQQHGDDETRFAAGCLQQGMYLARRQFAQRHSLCSQQADRRHTLRISRRQKSPPRSAQSPRRVARQPPLRRDDHRRAGLRSGGRLAMEELDEPHGEQAESESAREHQQRVTQVLRAKRRLRHARRLDHLEYRQPAALARFESGQALQRLAVRLFDLGEIVGQRLGLREALREVLHARPLRADLRLQAFDRRPRAGQILLCRGERALSTRRATRLDLALQFGQTGLQRTCLGVHGHELGV